MSCDRVLQGFEQTTLKLFTTRDLVEAKLISTPPYIVLSCCEMFERYPDLVRAVLEHCTPEEIGQEARKPGGQLNQRWIWTVGTLFMWGREFLISLGELDPEDRAEDIATVLDFVRDVSRSYRGDSCWVGVENDGGIVPSLDRETVERIERELELAEQHELSRLKRLNALLTTYTFLMGAESRKGMHAHGPYPVGSVVEPECWGIGARRQLWVKDFSDLGPNRYSYSHLAGEVDVQNVTIALVLDDVRAVIPPWGTHLITEPADYLDRTVAFAVYESDRGLVRRLDSDDVDGLVEKLTAAQTNLYLEMAEWSREEALRAGAECYFKANIEPVLRFANVTADVELSEVTDRLLALITDERAAEMLGRLASESFHPIALVTGRI